MIIEGRISVQDCGLVCMQLAAVCSQRCVVHSSGAGLQGCATVVVSTAASSSLLMHFCMLNTAASKLRDNLDMMLVVASESVSQAGQYGCDIDVLLPALLLVLFVALCLQPYCWGASRTPQSPGC